MRDGTMKRPRLHTVDPPSLPAVLDAWPDRDADGAACLRDGHAYCGVALSDADISATHVSSLVLSEVKFARLALSVTLGVIWRRILLAIWRNVVAIVTAGSEKPTSRKRPRPGAHRATIWHKMEKESRRLLRYTIVYSR